MSPGTGTIRVNAKVRSGNGKVTELTIRCPPGPNFHVAVMAPGSSDCSFRGHGLPHLLVVVQFAPEPRRSAGGTAKGP